MHLVTIPLLFCPFPPAVNPLAPDAARHTDSWVSAFNLHAGPAYGRYREDNFAWLTARFYPGAGLEQLSIANDLIVLLYAVDDLLDQQPDHLHTFIAHFTAVIEDRAGAFSKAQAPVLAAWADLWPRIVKISPPAWAEHFAQRLTAQLNETLLELGNAQPPLLTVAQHLEKRPYLAGAQLSTSIIPIIENIWLPHEALQHPVVTRLEQLCRNLVSWRNDLFSFGKEQLRGGRHNLVSILQQKRQLNQEEAILCAAAIYNTDMREFVALSGELPVYDEKTNRTLERYVEALRRHIRGNADWNAERVKPDAERLTPNA